MDFHKFSYLSILISIDMLHYIILYYTALMLMYCELSLCHIHLVHDFNMICKALIELDLSNDTHD